MSDRLLSSDDVWELFRRAPTALDALYAVRDAQDTKSYPLGEEAGIAKGRAEVVECIHRHGVGYALSEAQLKAWGLGTLFADSEAKP